MNNKLFKKRQQFHLSSQWFMYQCNTSLECTVGAMSDDKRVFVRRLGACTVFIRGAGPPVAWVLGGYNALTSTKWRSEAAQLYEGRHIADIASKWLQTNSYKFSKVSSLPCSDSD